MEVTFWYTFDVHVGFTYRASQSWWFFIRWLWFYVPNTYTGHPMPFLLPFTYPSSWTDYAHAHHAHARTFGSTLHLPLTAHHLPAEHAATPAGFYLPLPSSTLTLPVVRLPLDIVAADVYLPHILVYRISVPARHAPRFCCCLRLPRAAHCSTTHSAAHTTLPRLHTLPFLPSHTNSLLRLRMRRDARTLRTSYTPTARAFLLPRRRHCLPLGCSRLSHHPSLAPHLPDMQLTPLTHRVAFALYFLHNAPPCAARYLCLVLRGLLTPLHIHTKQHRWRLRNLAPWLYGALQPSWISVNNTYPALDIWYQDAAWRFC